MVRFSFQRIAKKPLGSAWEGDGCMGRKGGVVIEWKE